jgi:hypothetical protein
MTLLVNSKSGERHYQTEVFPLSVGNIDYLSCLGKLEHPYESRISQQSHKSAPTDGWNNLLVYIIGPYRWLDYFVNVHNRLWAR